MKNLSKKNPTRLVGACERQARVFGGARCAAWPVLKAPPKKKNKTPKPQYFIV
jgi:hypothetical protein